MITDSLTMMTIVVVVFTMILIIAAMIYSHRTMKKDMKALAQRTILMSSDEEIGRLCRSIMEINENACPLLEGDINKVLSHDADQLKEVLRKQLKQLQQV